MNYFEAKRKLNRETFFLYLLFFINIVITLIVVNFIVALYDFKLAGARDFIFILPKYVGFRFTTSTSLFMVCLTFFLIAFNYFTSITKERNGADVAVSLGCTEVTGMLDDPQLKRLNHIVDEMAIAAAVPIPRVFIIEDTLGINAFAAGYTLQDSVVAVTRDALLLERDKLQALIAHEMGHIRHLDMRYNFHVTAILAGFMGITTLGKSLLFTNSIEITPSQTGGFRVDRHEFKFFRLIGLSIVSIFLIVVGYLFYLVGRFIQSQISIKREYIADLNAVTFMRQAMPMVFLLRELRGETVYSNKLPSIRGEYHHFFFAPGIVSRFWFNTHPPLEKRIAAVQAHVTTAELYAKRPEKEDIPQPLAANKTAYQRELEREEKRRNKRDMGQKIVEGALVLGALDEMEHEETLPSVTEMIAQISTELLAVINNKMSVDTLFYALILSEDEERREEQLQYIDLKKQSDVINVCQLIEESRLAYPYILAELAYPILRQCEHTELIVLQKKMDQMITCIEEEMTGRQICLILSIEKRIQDIQAQQTAKRAKIKEKHILTLRSPQVFECIHLVLSAVAIAGDYASEEEKEENFTMIIRQLYPLHNRKPTRVEPREWRSLLQQSLTLLISLQDQYKEQLEQAIIRFIFIDDRITAKEYELVRVIGLYLDYHLPLDFRDIRLED